MTENGMKLRNWVIEKIKNEYPEDIDLLIAHHSHEVGGDEHGVVFDYYVPATERGNEMSRTFIIDKVGYDLYPRSWERLAGNTECNNDGEFTLYCGEIVYARNEQAAERFAALQQKLKANLADAVFCYRKALEQLEMAMGIYSTLAFEDKLAKVRLGAGYILDCVTKSVAFLNNRLAVVYAEDIYAMGSLPENFNQYRMTIMEAKTADEIKHMTHLLLCSVRNYAKVHQPKQEMPQALPDYRMLAAWYQELSLTWRRIGYFCAQGDASKAYYDACYLQGEYNAIAEEFGLREWDLLGCYDAKDLSVLGHCAKEGEAYLLSVLEREEVKLDYYDSLEQFLAEN